MDRARRGKVRRSNFGPAFISYATRDRKQALAVCEAIEARGTPCWISSRDVAPGDNYQEAIVQALRNSRAMVLVFSAAANESDEIKKELSLASRYHVQVIALRLQDVEPSDAFAYELSTRQWIDAFEGWEKSIDLIVGRLSQIAGEKVPAGAVSTPPRRTFFHSRKHMSIAAVSALLLLLVIGGAWWLLRPSPKAAHSMTVRLASFQVLSPDLPSTIRDAVGAEIAAAFNADGVVGVSTASAPPPGAAPAYALGGTIQREGANVRVITQLTNERSGATLWSDTFNYDGNEVARIPRHVAVDAGNVVRCGLFGASTYRKPLPDPVLKDYMQFCQGHWNPDVLDGRKALVPAQRVVAAAPDFSWGWAAVAAGFWKVSMGADDNRLADKARESGREAADRALSIDPENSEALWIKSMMIDRLDWIGREELLKRAVAARSLDCGCEHHQYGDMLFNVGRVTDGIDQLRRANDMLALYVYTPLSLARALVAAGKAEEAKPYFDAAADLAPNADFATGVAVNRVIETGDLKELADPKLPIDEDLRAALLKAYKALGSGDAASKAQAAQALLALPYDKQAPVVPKLLASLGKAPEAFQLMRRMVIDRFANPTNLWDVRMRETLNDPGFPALAAELGMMKYWKAAHAKPDACSEASPPPFCRMI